jgi:hypothetical protein
MRHTRENVSRLRAALRREMPSCEIARRGIFRFADKL